MPNILYSVKNSIYNSVTIDPVNITVELLENQKISSDKFGGISVFAFLTNFLVKGHHFGLVETGIISL